MTTSTSMIFPRTELAASLTRRLLNRGQGLRGGETSLRSGALLTGPEGVGKTVFILRELKPALERSGALVMYINLAQADIDRPDITLLNGIRCRLPSHIIEELKRDERTFADALVTFVDLARRDVVLIIDDFQLLLQASTGIRVSALLKMAHDVINFRQGSEGSFCFLGVGTHPAMKAEMMAHENAGFRAMQEIPFPVLGTDFVEFTLKNFEKDGETELPSLNIAMRAFELLGHAPDELLNAMAKSYNKPSSETLDESLMKIAEQRAISLARIEVEKVILKGSLASAIFTLISSDRILRGDLLSPISDQSVSEYSQSLGRVVTVDDSITAVNKLIAANLILRDGRDRCRVTNPLVRKLWRQRYGLEVSSDKLLLEGYSSYLDLF